MEFLQIDELSSGNIETTLLLPDRWGRPELFEKLHNFDTKGQDEKNLEFGNTLLF